MVDRAASDRAAAVGRGGRDRRAVVAEAGLLVAHGGHRQVVVAEAVLPVGRGAHLPAGAAEEAGRAAVRLAEEVEPAGGGA